MNKALEIIGASFPLTKLDAGEFTKFKASPLSVELQWYRAEGLGNVAVIHGKAMAGLMVMDTLVINALERDVPLFSYDYIAAMANRIMLTEYYDTCLAPADMTAFTAVKNGIDDLPDNDLGEHWYDYMKLPPSFSKKTAKRDLPRLEAAFHEALRAYVAEAASLPPLAAAASAEKRQRAAVYVDGLLTRGGPSTDAFKKSIGEERTRDLFTRIVFGTAE